jgi:hypothetical protein
MADRFVPFQLAIIDEERHTHRRKRFGHRGHGEAGFRGDGQFFFHITQAIRVLMEQIFSSDNGDSYAWAAPGLHGVVYNIGQSSQNGSSITPL